MDLPGLIPPLVAIAAMLLVGQRAAAARRRRALNRALHEIRRSLQSLMLFSEGAAPVMAGAVGMAASALEQLDREVNGSPSERAPMAPVDPRRIACASVERWRPAAARRGANICFRWAAGRATVLGRGPEIASALDNLIVNAVQHGGEEIELEAERFWGELVLTVADAGRRRPVGRGESLMRRLEGRRRHGHGLGIVRQIVHEHGGSFRLEVGPSGARATVRLPLHPLGREPGGVAEGLA